MKFKMEFDCDNAAFIDSLGEQIAEIVKRAADSIGENDDGDFQGGVIRDVNGNLVGEWSLEDDQ